MKPESLLFKERVQCLMQSPLFSGLTRGVVEKMVNRQLQHWKQEGIIDAHRGHLKVEALQELMKRAYETNQ